MELSTPEPWLPVVLTCICPLSERLTTPRWYSVRPAFLRMACWLCARTNKGGASVQPIMRHRAGRTKAKKVTITATGLPGRPNIRVWPMRPTAMGRPGRMAMRQKSTSPSSRIKALV